MTDKKLTDEDVVEGLERCISTTTDKACAECPFNKQNLCDIDQWALERYALDLIKRQKAENDSAKAKIEICAEVIERQDAEIERLNSAKDKLKAETYKEFAERLKQSTVMAVMGNKIHAVATSKGVDNLLKEMVGEEE